MEHSACPTNCSSKSLRIKTEILSNRNYSACLWLSATVVLNYFQYIARFGSRCVQCTARQLQHISCLREFCRLTGLQGSYRLQNPVFWANKSNIECVSHTEHVDGVTRTNQQSFSSWQFTGPQQPFESLEKRVGHSQPFYEDRVPGLIQYFHNLRPFRITCCPAS